MKGLTLNESRAVLRLDLKDSGALWSDGELNRSIERAVQDLSRHLPLENVYEETLNFTVSGESITTPAAASATAIVNAASIATVGNNDVLTIADYTPEVPRRLTVTLTDADSSVTKLTLTIKGYNQAGHYIKESWYLKDLVTAVARQGNLHFKRITQVEVNNVDGNSTGDTISVGIGNAYDSWVWVAYKPIKPKSETVTNAAGTTTYTRDTDYTMDYYNGAIRFISGGSMVAGTAYLISYTKSKLGLDISSVIPLASRITRVEYPTDQIPQQFANFSIYGNFLHIGSKQTGKSQEEMSVDHIAIYYEQPHSPPGEDSPGSYPSLLDELISIGAGGDALLAKALELEHQAVIDLAALRTELGLTTAVHTLTATALDKVATYVADMDTALNAAIVQAADAATALAKINSDSGRTYLTDADTALDAYVTAIAFSATALVKVTTYLETNTSHNAKAILTKILTDAAGLRTALLTAQDAANAELDAGDYADVATHITSAGTALAKVDTYLAGGTESVKALLALITTDAAALRTAIGTALDATNTTLDGISYTDVGTYVTAAITALTAAATAATVINSTLDGISVTDAETALAKVQTYLGEATISSKYWLTQVATLDTKTGIALDAINTALDAIDFSAVATHLTAATTALTAAAASAADSNTALDTVDLSAAITALDAANVISDAILSTSLDKVTTGAEAYLDTGDANLTGVTNAPEAQRHVDYSAARVSIANARVNAVVGYVQEAQSRIAGMQAVINEGGGYSIESSSYANEASQHVAAAVRIIERERGVIAQAEGYVAEANVRINETKNFVERSQSYQGIAQGFIQEAVQRISELTVSVNQAGGYGTEAGVYVGEAAQHIAAASRAIEREQVKVSQADGYVSEASSRLANLRGYIEQAQAYSIMANGFVAEASVYIQAAAQIIGRETSLTSQANGYIIEAGSRLDNLRSYMEQARAWMDVATGFVAEAEQRTNVALSRIQEAGMRISIADRYMSQATIMVNSSNVYIAEADGRFKMVQAFNREAEVRIVEINSHLQEAYQWAETVQGDIVLSDRFRTEGQARLNEFESKLRAKNEYRKRTSSVATRQPV